MGFDSCYCRRWVVFRHSYMREMDKTTRSLTIRSKQLNKKLDKQLIIKHILPLTRDFLELAPARAAQTVQSWSGRQSNHLTTAWQSRVACIEKFSMKKYSTRYQSKIVLKCKDLKLSVWLGTDWNITLFAQYRSLLSSCMYCLWRDACVNFNASTRLVLL